MRAGEADRLLAKLRAFMFAQGPQAPLVGASSGARLPYHRRAASRHPAAKQQRQATASRSRSSNSGSGGGSKQKIVPR